jgi:hypothetical protein
MSRKLVRDRGQRATTYSQPNPEGSCATRDEQKIVILMYSMPMRGRAVSGTTGNRNDTGAWMIRRTRNGHEIGAGRAHDAGRTW